MQVLQADIVLQNGRELVVPFYLFLQGDSF